MLSLLYRQLRRNKEAIIYNSKYAYTQSEQA